MSDATDAALAALKAALESCRSRLSTAEKDRAAVEAALVRRLDAAEKECEALRSVVRIDDKMLARGRAILEKILLGKPYSIDEVREAYDPIPNPGGPRIPSGQGAVTGRAAVAAPALSRSNTADAPTAPQASEVASDSSAPEKALGALRAWVAAYNNALQEDSERLSRTPRARETGLGYAPVYEAFRAARDLIGSVDAVSGGAHVDVPKADKVGRE